MGGEEKNSNAFCNRSSIAMSISKTPPDGTLESLRALHKLLLLQEMMMSFICSYRNKK
jgi:hypothetical protein